MITEDYCSFELSKLLKEKGFNASEIDAYFPFVYYSNGKMDFYNDDRPLFVCEAVTLQMAMKWLREVHKLHITILWDCGAYIGKNSFCYHINRINNYEDKGYNKIGFYSYEQACEAAIKYCLENLI